MRNQLFQNFLNPQILRPIQKGYQKSLKRDAFVQAIGMILNFREKS
jgi:hypothetical protein